VSSNYATTAYHQPTEEVLGLSECKDAQYPVKQGRKGMSEADTSFWRSGTVLKIERMISADSTAN
jgi:hypothetical protein